MKNNLGKYKYVDHFKENYNYNWTSRSFIKKKLLLKKNNINIWTNWRSIFEYTITSEINAVRLLNVMLYFLGFPIEPTIMEFIVFAKK